LNGQAAPPASGILARSNRRSHNPGPASGVRIFTHRFPRRPALGFSLTLNHPFLDGNKRTAHAAMEVLVLLNGSELVADVDDQERLMLALAAGRVTREELTDWLEQHLKLSAG